MDKKIIKEHLKKTFLVEADTPGISVTDKVKKESDKINKEGLKNYSKEVKAKEDKDNKKMGQNKFNYADKFEKTYHDEMEIMNGQEMLQYDGKPNEDFVKKAKDGIEGTSKMGNQGKIGNTEAAFGASSDNFGKDLLKKIKDSQKKRSEQTPTLNLRGQDIQADVKDTGHKPYAIEESESGLGKWVPPSEEEKKRIHNFVNNTGTPEEIEARRKYKERSDMYDRNIKHLEDKKLGNKPVEEMAGVPKPISDKNKMVLTNWVTKLGANKAAEKLINALSQTGMVSDLPDSNEYGSGLNKVESYLVKQDLDKAFQTAKTLATKLEKKGMKGMFENEEIDENQSKVAIQADKKLQIKNKTKEFNDGEDYEKINREVEHGVNPDNNNNNKPKIKESMKRLKFKTTFNGLGNALKLIPEGYRVDKREFEMTDGNETYRIRWEGNLNEGKAVVVTASDKSLVNEDINRMKALFGYKSQDTLGLVKGNARVDENKIFNDIWNKSKALLGESEDMEGAKATEGNWEEEKKKAPEATKHVSTAKASATTTKPKEKNWEEISGGEKMMETEAPAAKESNPDKAKSQAPEAKKDISTAKGKGNSTAKPTEKNWEDVSGGEKMFDGVAPAAKEGHWEDISVPQAAEAKKHVHLKESDVEEELMENEGFDDAEETEDGNEKPDTWNKPEDDDSSDDKEPAMSDLGGGVPPMDDSSDDEGGISIPKPNGKGAAQLLFSPSKGIYWIKGPGLPMDGMEVPSQFLQLASDKSKKASVKASIIIKKMEEMDSDPSMEPSMDDEM